MFHLAAWTEDLVTATLTDVDPVPDTIFTIANSHFLLPRRMNLVAAVAMATNLQRARINSPTVRQINPNYIRPTIGALVPGTDPNVAEWFRDPFPMREDEEVIIEAIQNAGANQRVTVLAWFMEQFRAAPRGQEFNFRFTSTSTATANAWTQLTYTFETAPPVGTYAVIGGEVQSTNGQAFQMVFDDQFLRPGGLMLNALSNRTWRAQYDGSLGLWGNFRTINQPRILVLCNGADNSFDGYMRVVRVSDRT